MKKVRIRNEGGPAYMTKVTDAETGESLDHVFRVTLTYDVNDKQPPMALLWMYTPVVDVIIDAEIRHVCPACGRPEEEREG
jgi:hypothetical protein